MRALAITESDDHVCGRYRVRAFAGAVRSRGWSIETRGLARGLVARLRQFRDAKGFETVLLQRKLLPDWQLGLLRRQARALIFDFDDAVLYRDSYDPRGPHCPRRLRRFRRTVRAADAVIAGNAFLAEAAEAAGANPDRIRIIPTCIDLDRYPSPRMASTPRVDDGVELAWVGSSSTLAGLESTRGIWEAIGRDVSGARLRLICDRFPDFGPLAVVADPWSETSEAASLARADVGVSWIPDDLWSRGKCGLKVLQYGAAGLPTIANTVGVHPEMIHPGETGFLVDSTEAWVEAARSLRDDAGLASRMGDSARRAVEQCYSTEVWGQTFARVITGEATPSLPRPRSLPDQVGGPRGMIPRPDRRIADGTYR